MFGCGEPPISKEDSMANTFNGVKITNNPSSRAAEMPKASKPDKKPETDSAK
jgi:hypothetical protein